jgi:hypothetical protein
MPIGKNVDNFMLFGDKLRVLASFWLCVKGLVD